jgi:hypothetical protein
MKHLQLVILCLITFSLGAQITITNAYFPEAGDTLLTATDNMPTGIQIGTPGPDREWNFKSLQSPIIVRTIIRPASEGAAAVDFPDANLVFKLNENAEGYYKVTAGTLELIGLSGTDPINLGIDIQPKLNDPQIERWAPLEYGDTHDSDVKFSYALDADEIPQDLLDILPITPDSIRLRLQLNRHDEIDAWGSLSIPGHTYEVLREKRTLDQNIRLDAKIGILGWQDITDIVLGLTDLGSDALGESQIVRYHFWSEGVKEPIAVVTMAPDLTTVTAVDFKAEDILADLVQTTDKLQPSVLAYPNPAMAHTNFQFVQLKPGNYRLVIYNLVGSKVWQQDYRINGPLTERVSLSRLKKGTYLYALEDERGRTLLTRRLVVVRP